MQTFAGPTSLAVALFAWLCLENNYSHAQGPESVATHRAKRAEPIDMPNVPDWLANHKFEKPELRFARVKYSSNNTRLRGAWATDYPDADLALAAQVESLTQLVVPNPGTVIELTNSELRQFDILYLAEGGSLHLTADDSAALRKYLNDGGFLMLDDTVGDEALQNIQDQLKKVFPDKKLIELTIEHPIFHHVFDLKELPQSLCIHVYMRKVLPTSPASYWAIMDGDQVSSAKVNNDSKLSVLVCHNTDLGDGWERARESEDYKNDISAKIAFPMAINIIFHALSSQR